jgi:hypothetical protein
MQIIYTFHTPSMLDAKQQAVILAKNQGFSSALVTDVKQPEYGEFQVTLVVSK